MQGRITIDLECRKLPLHTERFTATRNFLGEALIYNLTKPVQHQGKITKLMRTGLRKTPQLKTFALGEPRIKRGIAPTAHARR